MHIASDEPGWEEIGERALWWTKEQLYQNTRT